MKESDTKILNKCKTTYRYNWAELHSKEGFPGGSDGKESACNAGDAGDAGSIPGWGRSPGGGHGNPLQCSCLENPKDRGTWWATVHRVTKSWTWLKWLSRHTHNISYVYLIVHYIPRTYLTIGSLYLLLTFIQFPFPPHPAPDNYQSDLFFYEFIFKV